MQCREGLGHRTTPGKIARTRVALLPGAVLAEVITDEDSDSWVHVRDPDGAWGAWHHLAHRTDDVDLTAAPDGDGALIAVVAFVPDAYLSTGLRPPGDAYQPPVTRTFLRLTAAGLTDAGMGLQ